MSLKVWLPLNGNIKNQGLDDISMSGGAYSWGGGKVTNHSAYFHECAIYNNSTAYNFTTQDFSWSTWVYYYATWGYAFTVGRADTGGYGYGLIVHQDGLLGCWFGSTLYNISVPSSTWSHIAFVKKDTNIKIYVNGTLVVNETFSGSYPTYSDGDGLGLGCFRMATNSMFYWYDGHLNDFRIYDNAISAKEVKELSKGLCLHYKLSRGGENYLRNSYNSFAGNTSLYTDTDPCGFPAMKEVADTDRYWSHYGSGSYTTVLVQYGDVWTQSFMYKQDTASAPVYSFMFQNVSGVQCSNVKLYVDGVLKGETDRSDGGVPLDSVNDCVWHNITIVRTFNTYWDNSSNLYKAVMLRAQGYTYNVSQMKIEKGSVATSWIPNVYDSLYELLGYSNKNLKSIISTWTDTWREGGDWNFHTFTKSDGGNYTAGTKYHFRCNCAVLSGSFSEVTLLFYNLNTNTGYTQYNVPIINGVIDADISTSVDCPHFLIYSGIAGSASGKSMTLSNMILSEGSGEELDSSGYNQNSILYNNFNFENGSPRYLGSYRSYQDSFIKGVPLSFISSGTVCFWRKNNSCGASGWLSLSSPEQGTSYYLSATTSGSGTFYHGGCGSPVCYIDGVENYTPTADNNWHFYCFTNIDFSSWTSPFYYNRYYPDGYTEWNCDNNTVDLRIYATSLSVDDIKALYNEGASLANDNTILVREVVES